MAIWKDKVLVTLPQRWVSAQKKYVLVSQKLQTWWCSQNLSMSSTEPRNYLIFGHNYFYTRSVIFRQASSKLHDSLMMVFAWSSSIFRNFQALSWSALRTLWTMTSFGMPFLLFVCIHTKWSRDNQYSPLRGHDWVHGCLLTCKQVLLASQQTTMHSVMTPKWTILVVTWPFCVYAYK